MWPEEAKLCTGHFRFERVVEAFGDREVAHPPGALAIAGPEIVLGSDVPPWTNHDGFRYRALGQFSGRVVVVARKR